MKYAHVHYVLLIYFIFVFFGAIATAIHNAHDGRLNLSPNRLVRCGLCLFCLVIFYILKTVSTQHSLKVWRVYTINKIYFNQRFVVRGSFVSCWFDMCVTHSFKRKASQRDMSHFLQLKWTENCNNRVASVHCVVVVFFCFFFFERNVQCVCVW